MGRQPCCNNDGVKKGPWRPEEDILLVSYVQQHGPGNWRAVPAKSGLGRCSKSCRLRWTNYLRPGIKRGNFTEHEEEKIFHLQALLGNKWAAIASYLPQRTDNDIKNHWNTHLKKKLLKKMYTIQSGSTKGDASSQPLHKAWEALEALPRQGTPPPETKPNPNCTYASSTGNIARLLQGWTKNSLIPATTNSAPTAVPAGKQRSVNGAAPEAGEIEGGNGNEDDELSEACHEGRREHAPTRLVEDWLFDEMEGYGEAQGVEEGFIPLDFLMK